jgi:hypothetical protein
MIVVRVVEKCDDDSCWISFFLSIADCSFVNCFDFSSEWVMSLRVSSSLHRFESVAQRDFFHDQREFRRTRDEVSSISRSETHDLLQISIHLRQKSRLLTERSSHLCHLQFLITARAHSTHRQREFFYSRISDILRSHFARKYYDRSRLVMFSSLVFASVM